jgi:predicted ATPase
LAREWDNRTVQVVGRGAEIRAVETLMERPLPAALVVAGEAGIGKTTIWEAGLTKARAASFPVLQCRCAGAEAQFSFAGLADLLAPVVEPVLSDLPTPQRRALAVALLLDDPGERPPDQRAIAAATLGALRLLADESPLLVAIDDVQWLDASTRAVLEFVVRRLANERIGLLLTVRGRGIPPPLGLDRALPDGRLESLELGPLSLEALHALLEERLGSRLPRPLLRNVRDASGGNPFFALEIARALDRGEIRPRPGEPLPVPKDLQDLAAARIAVLPATAREVLLAAAALARPTLPLLEKATGHGLASIGAAIDADILVAGDDDVRFTHPLLAAAAYSGTSAAARREMHGRLAAVVDEPEERARHRALAAAEPDSAIAGLLDEAARARRCRRPPTTCCARQFTAILPNPSGT